jgi:hypothetical protein
MNSHLWDLHLRFDRLSVDKISDFIRALIAGKGILTTAFKDTETGENIIYKGSGSEGDPLLQSKVLPWGINFNVGWHCSWDEWVKFRDDSVETLKEVVSDFEIDDIFFLDSVSQWTIPQKYINQESQIRSDFLSLSIKIFPDGISRIESFNMVLWDVKGIRAALSLESDSTLDTLKITLRSQTVMFDSGISFWENLQEHFRNSELTLSKVNSAIEGLLKTEG